MDYVKGLQIGITGGMRAGKDEVGEYLVRKYGFKRFAFADGVRKVSHKLFPSHYEAGKPRKLLQDFGQFCVSLDKNVWVDYLFREMLYQGIDPVVDNVVITDVRQPHEYEKLLESGFTIVFIDRDEEVRKSLAGVSDGEFYHETEQHYKNFEHDFSIINDGTLEDLYDQVDTMIFDMTGGDLNGSRRL